MPQMKAREALRQKMGELETQPVGNQRGPARCPEQKAPKTNQLPTASLQNLRRLFKTTANHSATGSNG